MQANEAQRALAVWQRKYGQVASGAPQRMQQLRFLAGRGFSLDVVRRVVLGAARSRYTRCVVTTDGGAIEIMNARMLPFVLLGVLTAATPSLVDLKSIDYGTQFVAVGGGGNIFTSTNGATWTASSPTGTTADLNALIRVTLAYLTVGAAGTNLIAR